ncbi:MAG TPA: hypothetical protein VFY49_06245 [Myxococcota bacterium]|nr:hypothetical protein [Myxococcota bacterium]
MSARDALTALLGAEISRPAPAAAQAFAGELRRRHGGALAAVLFYGSCLRRGTDEGVLDFYALVDDYPRAYRSRARNAYSSRALALANAALPPNVFYLEIPHEGRRLRAKYAVFSLRDFARAVQPSALRTGTWARFCQPSLAAYVRDAAARDALHAALGTAVETAVLRGLSLLPGDGDARRAEPEALWLGLFRETYGSELRPESDEGPRAVVAADPTRYARVLAAALEALEADARLRIVSRDAGGWQVACPPGELAATRRRSALRRPFAKAAATLQLLKSALTFGDWLPYALWKLERHTGTRLEPSERQRRHPFVYGWPLILRVLWKRELR